ncbi:SixA phosphatase family protein [Flavobacterium sp. N2270]|uniref:SixA phosphatase family protein n=1 Tax=Flavobacterium sp. N2270 TaxID=2986831 RepID=UPI0022248C7A|nr:histidine phosphatase family protein [Flavobacterium sp. N2270]
MKNLIIVRHSKSSWDLPLNDIDRPLSKRGIHDAHLISSKLHDLLPKSFIIWSSNAKRAKETAMIFSQNLLISYENIQIEEELYTFEVKKLEEFIKKCKNTYDNLILFGHNEAITNFVNKFGDTFIENVPTSGVVFMHFDTNDWNELEKGKVNRFIFPSHYKHEQYKSKQIHR